MRPAAELPFLARRSYRRKRLADAARILPFIGGVLFLMPVLWGGEGGIGARTSAGLIYLFLVWAALIVVSGLLARVLMRAENDARQDPEEAEPR